MVFVGLLPVGVVGIWLVFNNKGLVAGAEQERQLAVASKAKAETLRHVEKAMDVTSAVAVAIRNAAKDTDATDPMAGVHALLGAHIGVEAVRLEIPAAQVNTVIQSENHTGPVPASTPELRAIVDKEDENLVPRGVAAVMQPDGTCVVVARVDPVREGGHVGYVTASANVEPLDERLADVAEDHFNGETVGMVVVDSFGRVVAEYHTGSLRRGEDALGLPVWKMLPDGVPWSVPVGAVQEMEINDRPHVVSVSTVPELGWAVAIWRSEDVAYFVYAKLRRDVAFAMGSILLMAIVIDWFAGRTIAQPVLRIARQVQSIGQRRWIAVNIDTRRGDEIGLLASSIQKMAEDLRASEQEVELQARQRNDLSRFLSKELVDAILEGRHPLSLGGKRAYVSVLFADVVAFTPLAETRPAEKVVRLLNELFSMLSEIVFRHQGMVDKFIGDCVMAVWGAAEAQPDHAARAVAAADDMMRFLETAAGGWQETYGVEVRLGIGINSGQALVGNVGSSKRMEFTVIGDVVNVASRLETLAKPNQVLLTTQTRAAIGDDFDVVSLGEHDITGHTRVEVFELCQGG